MSYDNDMLCHVIIYWYDNDDTWYATTTFNRIQMIFIHESTIQFILQNMRVQFDKHKIIAHNIIKVANNKLQLDTSVDIAFEKIYFSFITYFFAFF